MAARREEGSSSPRYATINVAGISNRPIECTASSAPISARPRSWTHRSAGPHQANDPRVLLHRLLTEAVMKKCRIAGVDCARRRSHLSRAEFILKFCVIGEQSFRADFGNHAGVSFKNRRWKCTMLNRLIVAATVAAFAYAAIPANAAKVSAGCSGDNLSKTETMIENMADGEGKMMAQKEIAAAQDALLSGKMGACSMHLSKAMHAAWRSKVYYVPIQGRSHRRAALSSSGRFRARARAGSQNSRSSARRPHSCSIP
mgnify:CR=1 FL=1